MNKLNDEIQSYRRMIAVLDQCIDDYLFVIDIENDSCYISPHAEVRFKMENHEFKNPIEKFKEIIYVFLTIFLYLLKCPQSLIL